MAYQTEIIRGSNLSGSEGYNRTYTLTESNPQENTIEIFIDKSYAHKIEEWTYSSGVITFLQYLSDSAYITIKYISGSITSTEFYHLCTVTDVKDNIETVGRWTDAEIQTTIEQISEEVYDEMGQPVQASWSEIGKIDNTVQSQYYVGEENIYRVDRIFYGTTTKQELYQGIHFKTNPKYGMIKIYPVASSGLTLDVTNDIEIEYVPNIVHQIALFRTITRLLEKLDMTSGGTVSKELAVAERRLAMIEQIWVNRICLQTSGQVKYYDNKYGVNRKHIIQDLDRNLYVASTDGWEN